MGPCSLLTYHSSSARGHGSTDRVFLGCYKDWWAGPEIMFCWGRRCRSIQFETVRKGFLAVQKSRALGT